MFWVKFLPPARPVTLSNTKTRSVWNIYKFLSVSVYVSVSVCVSVSVSVYLHGYHSFHTEILTKVVLALANSD